MVSMWQAGCIVLGGAISYQQSAISGQDAQKAIVQSTS
jgi:hypothetical protein